MKITLSSKNKDLKISDVQQMFSSEFPYLKIEFFKKPHKEFKGSPKKELLSEETLIAEILQKDGSIEFSENNTVREVEKMFENAFGLHVQIFRKSGNTFLETSVTDNWTLQKQNDTGKESLEKISR